MQTYDMPQTAELIEACRRYPNADPDRARRAVRAAPGRNSRPAVAQRRSAAGQLAVVESAEQTKAGVRYKEPKSGRARNVALSSTVIEELRAWRTQAGPGAVAARRPARWGTFVCTQADGMPYAADILDPRMGPAHRRSGLPRIRFHDLRHAHATHLLASGVHPKVASERLGHSKVGITLDLYSHVMPGMQEDAVAKVDAALQSGPQTLIDCSGFD